MEKVYSIDPSRLGSVAWRDTRKKAYLLYGSVLFYLLLMAPANYRRGVSNTPIYFSGIVTSFLLGLFLLSFYRFRKTFYSLCRITVNDYGIYKTVDRNELASTGFMAAFFLSRTGNHSQLFDYSMRWRDIKTVSENGGGLSLKSAGASAFYGTGSIAIPKETGHFQEIKETIGNEMRKING